MKVSGFTFIRNAVRNDYPVVEAITSILPLCDEFIVVVGNSDDGTRGLIEAINSPVIKIIDSVWDESLKEGGKVFAAETDKAFAAISPDADWCFYIQGDEAVHEKYHPLIKKEMQDALNKPNIEGLLFKYLHFYGSYDYYGHSRRWYRREIRLLKNINGIHAYRDAQGFRLNDRKINVKLIDAYIYHYGWAKPPQGLNNKVRNFNQFYHDENWMAQNLPETYEFDYSNADRLIRFTGTHPAPMQKRIAATNWNIDFDSKKLRAGMDFRRKALQKIEDVTGWRVGEYRNYKIVER
ncbi:glycosyltransferase family 2 protein [Mucilaginibacter sp. cycad4]|uniref:glycosyltransferase family 2 protein n=1 Tax=Mucilaginibacter sp. cycad4 TaxID=3342096 RepID=UPI002AAAC4D7|nr:glycosyltransferase family 2 protein [Mucilaginibacter gossypii]WPV02516.1 glycosyltransferase family 2 protein [Mucilaginibacter gossypii]